MLKHHRNVITVLALVVSVLAGGCASPVSDADLLHAGDIPGPRLATTDLAANAWDPDVFNVLSAHICGIHKFPARSPLADLEHRAATILGPGKISVEEAVYADDRAEIEAAYAHVADAIQQCLNDPTAWNNDLDPDAVLEGANQTATAVALSDMADEGIAFRYGLDDWGSQSCTHWVAVVRVSDRLGVVMLNQVYTPETFTDDDFRTIVDTAVERLTA